MGRGHLTFQLVYVLLTYIKWADCGLVARNCEVCTGARPSMLTTPPHILLCSSCSPIIIAAKWSKRDSIHANSAHASIHDTRHREIEGSREREGGTCEAPEGNAGGGAVRAGGRRGPGAGVRLAAAAVEGALGPQQVARLAVLRGLLGRGDGWGELHESVTTLQITDHMLGYLYDFLGLQLLCPCSIGVPHR